MVATVWQQLAEQNILQIRFNLSWRYNIYTVNTNTAITTCHQHQLLPLQLRSTGTDCTNTISTVCPPVSTGNAFTTRNTYDSSITHDQWEQIAMLYGFSEEPTVAGKLGRKLNSFLKKSKRLIYRYGDEIFYRFLKAKMKL